MSEKMAVETEQSDGVYTMFEEVVAEIAQLKRRPPTSAQDITFVLLRTVLPLIRDLAFYARENRMDIDSILEDGPDSGGTQFTSEDVKKFEMVAHFTKQSIETILPTLMQERPEEASRLQFILATANECIEILGSANIVDESDEGEGEDSAEAFAQDAQTQPEVAQESADAGAN